MKKFIALSMGIAVFGIMPAFAGPDDFHSGPVIAEYGQIASVPEATPFSKKDKFKVLFDFSEAGEPGEVNKHLNTVARFLNMHVEHGALLENIEIAVVVHGGAAKDLLNDEAYGAANDGAANVNLPLIEALIKQRVKIRVCGQTAAYYDIIHHELIPGVKMSLSAMTANAQFQQQGYTLNPF